MSTRLCYRMGKLKNIFMNKTVMRELYFMQDELMAESCKERERQWNMGCIVKYTFDELIQCILQFCKQLAMTENEKQFLNFCLNEDKRNGQCSVLLKPVHKWSIIVDIATLVLYFFKTFCLGLNLPVRIDIIQ